MASSFRSVLFNPRSPALTLVFSCRRQAQLLAFGLGFSMLGLLVNAAASRRQPPQLASASLHSVFGTDKRQELMLDSAPYTAIGRIELQENGVLPWENPRGVSVCTGTLVGPDLVLTNAHCVLDKGEGSLTHRVIWFRPAFGRISPTVAARATKVWLGSLQPAINRAQDWALLKIDQNFGDQYAWLEATPLWEVQPFPSRVVSLIAYGTDIKDGGVPTIHRDCELTTFDRRGDYFRHSCDMNAGASGGPLLIVKNGRPTFLAINAAHVAPQAISYLPSFSAALANIAIGSGRFAALIDSLRQGVAAPTSVAFHVFTIPSSAASSGHSTPNQ